MVRFAYEGAVVTEERDESAISVGIFPGAQSVEE
jgi:hypothetical protein